MNPNNNRRYQQHMQGVAAAAAVPFYFPSQSSTNDKSRIAPPIASSQPPPSSLDEEAEPMDVEKRVRFSEDEASLAILSSSPSPLDQLIEEDKDENDVAIFDEIWYRHEEIKVFRDEAREICLRMRKRIDAEEAILRLAATTSVRRSYTPPSSPPMVAVSAAAASSSPCSTPSPCTRRGSTGSNSSGGSPNSASSLRTPLLARDERTRGLERRACPERHRRTYLCMGMILKGAYKFHDDPDKLAALAQKCTAWATALALEEGHRDHQRAMVESDSDSAFDSGSSSGEETTEMRVLVKTDSTDSVDSLLKQHDRAASTAGGSIVDHAKPPSPPSAALLRACPSPPLTSDTGNSGSSSKRMRFRRMTPPNNNSSFRD